MKTLEIRIYVGTYNKYNNGSIFGEWLELSDYSSYEEFDEACRELHKDEDDPEFMFQDFEAPGLFESLGLISESHLSEEIFEAIEELEAASYDIEIYSSYATHIGFKGDISALIEETEEAYAGEFDNDEEFAQEMAEQTGMMEEKPSWPYTCIDWEWAARELMYDYFEEDGHYFRSM